MEERIEELEVKIKELLDDKKYHQIRELLMDLNEADIAEIIETIEIKEDVVRVFRLLPKDTASSEYKSFIICPISRIVKDSIIICSYSTGI